MILRAAGHGGLVSPLEFGGPPRKLPKWMWGAIGVSVALHLAGGIFLYSQQFIAVVPEQDDGRTITLIPYTPPPPPPIVQRTPPKPAASPPIRSPLTAPPPTASTAPFTPNPTATAPTGPITTLTPTPPVTSPTGTGDVQALPGVIRNPTWISKPTGAQMERAYPQRPLEAGLGGRVVIQCAVTVSGALTGCSVASETPQGRGFGSAALRLSKYFRMSPRTVDGRPVEGAMVSVPITFAVS